MTLDDSLSERLHDLLEQTRHELRTCKKSLAFKESLLTDLELENAELAENNEKLDRELQCLKRQELRRSEFDRANDDCVDDGYGQWSHDEDDFPLYAATEIEKPKQSEHGRCSTCETLDLERSELFERIEELQEQLELARKVNKVLQEDVNQKTAQIADLTEALLQKQAREERLEADLQFTAAEREIALRDLQDSQMSLFSSRRSSEEYFRSSSIGSSLAEELGLDRNDILTGDKRFPPSFVDWDEILAEPEAGPLAEFESISAKSSRETSVELDLPSLGTQKAELTDESESSQNDSSEDGNLIEENEPQMERATSPSQIHQDEWKNLQYSALQSVCPTLSGPFRRRAQECKTKNNLLRRRDQRTGNAQDEVDMRRRLPTNDSSLLRTHQDEQLD